MVLKEVPHKGRGEKLLLILCIMVGASLLYIKDLNIPPHALNKKPIQKYLSKCQSWMLVLPTPPKQSRTKTPNNTPLLFKPSS